MAYVALKARIRNSLANDNESTVKALLWFYFHELLLDEKNVKVYSINLLIIYICLFHGRIN